MLTSVLLDSLPTGRDRKSTRLNSRHTDIYTLALHDALPIWKGSLRGPASGDLVSRIAVRDLNAHIGATGLAADGKRSEEHTSELPPHRYLHSCPTRRSSDLEGKSARTRVRRSCIQNCRTKLECSHRCYWTRCRRE